MPGCCEDIFCNIENPTCRFHLAALPRDCMHHDSFYNSDGGFLRSPVNPGSSGKYAQSVGFLPWIWRVGPTGAGLSCPAFWVNLSPRRQDASPSHLDETQCPPFVHLRPTLRREPPAPPRRGLGSNVGRIPI